MARPTHHIEERLNAAQERLNVMHQKADKVMDAAAAMMDAIAFGNHVQRMREQRRFVPTPWFHPARWFGYTWRRADVDPPQLGGGFYRWEYWTDKQLAHRAFKLAAVGAEIVSAHEVHTNEHYRE